MIVNKTSNSLISTIAWSGFTPTTSAQVYRHSADNLSAIVRQSDQAVMASGFTATFPASSITLIVMPAMPLNLSPPVYLPLVKR